MRKIVIAFVLLCLTFCSTALAQDHVFQKQQSYELADLIKELIPQKGSDYIDFLQNIHQRDMNIYWIKESSPFDESYAYYNEGRAGILVNSQGRTEYKQQWINGMLKNSEIEIGLPATVAVCGDLYWRPILVKIYTAAPVTLAKLSKEEYPLTERLLHTYFSNKKINLEHLNKKGDFSYGKNLYKLTINDKIPAWIIIETSQGNAMGNTIISIYYKQNDALQEWNK